MLTENMVWAWNVVFVCNPESIFLRVSTSEVEPPPLLHITTLTTAPNWRQRYYQTGDCLVSTALCFVKTPVCFWSRVVVNYLDVSLLFSGHIYSCAWHKKRPTVARVARSVCLSVEQERELCKKRLNQSRCCLGREVWGKGLTRTMS